jgi:hypothetical protein
MFPRSCFLDWLSKSKSSTRVPSTTATRVSSGWTASINILFDIQFFSTALAGVERQGPDVHERARAEARSVLIDASSLQPRSGVSDAAHGV